jgi:hypothetical protein
MTYTVALPDGRTVEFPDSVSREEAAAIIRRQLGVGAKPEGGFIAAAKAGATELGGGLSALAGKLGLKDEAKAEAEYQAAKKRAAEIFKPTEEGWTEAPFTKFKELLGGSVPYMAAPLAAGAAAATLPVTGTAAALTTLGAAGLTSAGQFTATNLARQMEEGKTLGETSLGSAAAAAIPQAALDTLSMRMIPGIGRLFGQAGIKITAENAKEIAEQGLKRTLIDYTVKTGKTAGIEGTTEAAQQVFERLQAGLNITDEKARDEYFESFLGGAVLGGALAVPGRYTERGREQAAAQDVLQRQTAEQAKAKRNAQLAAEEAEEARKQSPEYAQEFAQSHEALQQEYNDLTATLKEKLPKGASFADRQANKDLIERRKALTEQLKEQAPEYNRVMGVLRPIREQEAAAAAAAKPPVLTPEQQRIAGLSPLEYQMEQAGVDLTPLQPRVFTGEETFAPPPPSPAPAVAYAQSRINLANEQAFVDSMDSADRPSFYVAYLMQDPAMAQALVAGDVAIPGLKKRESNAILSGLKLQLKERDKQQKSAEAEALKEQQAADAAAQQRTAQQQQAKAAFEATQRVGQGVEGFQQRMGDIVEKSDQQRAVAQAFEALAPTEGVPAPSRALTDVAQQLQLAPETKRIDRANQAIRATEELIAARKAAGQDATVPEARLAKLQKIKDDAEKNLQRKLFDLAQEGQAMPRKGPATPVGPKQRVAGEFKLFGEAEPAAREVTYEGLSERLARLQATPGLSDDAYDFLSRVESVLPKEDVQAPGREATEGLKPGVGYTTADTTPSYTPVSSGKEAKISYSARQADGTEVQVEIFRPVVLEKKKGAKTATPVQPTRLANTVSDVRIRKGNEKPFLTLGAQEVQTDEQVLQKLVDTDAIESVQQPKATRPEGQAAPQSLYQTLDEQLRRIETQQEGVARPGAGRETMLKAFPATGRAAVEAPTTATPDDVKRQALFQQKLAQGASRRDAAAAVFKATPQELEAAVAPAERKEVEGTAAVEKRLGRDISRDTIRGPSAQALPLSMQEELEPIISRLERGRAETQAGQQALFPEEQEKIVTERKTPAQFQRFLKSAAADRLRDIADPGRVVERSKERMAELQKTLDYLQGVIDEITEIRDKVFPIPRLNAARKELSKLETLIQGRETTTLGEAAFPGVSARIDALRSFLSAADEQTAKLKGARALLKKRGRASFDQYEVMLREAGGVLKKVTTQAELKGALEALERERNPARDARLSVIQQANISEQDKALLNEMVNAVNADEIALQKQIQEIDARLAYIDANIRLEDASQRMSDYADRAEPDATMLAAASKDVRTAQREVNKLKALVSRTETKLTAEEAARKRQRDAVDREERRTASAEKLKAEQARLERAQSAPEGVDAEGRPLQATTYPAITAAQRLAKEDPTPTILADEMRQIKGNPQQVLKGYKSRITDLTKQLQEALDRARRFTVEGVKERKPYENALAAYNRITSAEGRAKFEPTLRKLEEAYRDAVTNAMAARVMPKGVLGFQTQLAEMLRKEAWLQDRINRGAVETATVPTPTVRMTAQQKQAQEAERLAQYTQEAATRAESPEIDATETTKTQIEKARKSQKTRYTGKGVGQDTTITEDAAREQAEQRTMLRQPMTPQQREEQAILTIVNQAKDKKAKKEPLTEIEQMVLDQYNLSRSPSKGKAKEEVEEAAIEEDTSEERTERAYAKERATFEAEELEEVGGVQPTIASLFGVSAEEAESLGLPQVKSRKEFAETVQEQIRSAGTSTLARFATKRARLNDVESQLAFIEANKNGPVVAGAKTLSDKQQSAKQQLETEKGKLQTEIDALSKDLKKIKTPDIDAATETLEQLAATASQGPALKEPVDTEDSAAAVAANVAENGSTELNRAIGQRLKLLLGNTRMELVDDLRDPDGAAAYGQAAVDGSFIRLDKKYGLNERTFLHEGTHAAVERVLRMPEDRLTDAQLRAKRELEELFEAYKKLPNASNENAKTSLSEFASEALSDDVMQAEMRQQKWTLRHMWDTFKSLILDMLGVKTPANMLDATLASVDNLMTRVPRATAQDMSLLGPKVLNRPRGLNPELAEADAVARRVVAGNRSWWQGVKANSTGLGFETQVIDRFAGFERLRKYLPKLQGTQMMSYLRMYDQRMNFVSQSAGNGALDLLEIQRKDGEREFIIESQDGTSLRSVVITLKRATPMVGDANATSRLFTLYVAANRAKRVGYDKLDMSGQVTEQELRQVLQKVDSVPGLKDIFETARDQYNEYNEGLVRFAQKTGVFSKDYADKLLSAKDYIPWYRSRNGVVELVIGGEAPFKVGNVKDMPHLAELVGGDKPILDFTISSIQNTNMLVDMSLRNLATKNAVMELVDLGAAKVTNKPISGTDVVKFRVKGEDRYAILDTETIKVNGKDVNTGVPADLLVKGMEGIPVQLTGALRMMAMPTTILRKAITLMPPYMLRQIVRDSTQAFIASGADITPVLGALREIGSAAGKKLEKRGIVGGQMFTGTTEDISLIMRDMLQGGNLLNVGMGKLEALGMEADALTRRAQYNSYLKQGMSEMEATLLALESMNFNKRGASPSIHFANSMIPFFNAQIQGLNVLYRAMFGQITAAEKARIKQKLITRGMMMFAISLAYTHAMQDDEAYKNALPEDKYGNWFVRIPGVAEPLRVPIPFELGYIFKALPEALYNILVPKNYDNAAEGGNTAANAAARAASEQDAAAQAFKAILRNTVPGGSSYFIPQVFKPGIEVASNFSFFTGRDIVSAKEQLLLPQYQYRDQTTELAKLFGGAGISPIKFEALIRGYLGGAGMAVLAALSLPLVREGPEKATKRLSDMPVVGTMFQPNDARWIINNTFDQLREAQQVQASFKDLVNKGERAEAKQLLETRATDYARAELGGYLRQQMGELTQMETAIKASNKSPDEKREILNKIQQYRIRLASMTREASDAAKLQQLATGAT